MTRTNNPPFFILCPAYHGATLFSLLLSNHSRVISLGDTLPSSQFDQICGCKELVSKCMFWQEAIQTTAYFGKTGSTQIIPNFPIITPSKKINRLFTFYLYIFFIFFKFNFSPNNFTRSYGRFVNYVLKYYNKDIFIDGGKVIERFLRIYNSEMTVGGIIHVTRSPQAFSLLSLKNNKNIKLDRVIQNYNKYHRKVLYLSKSLNVNYIRIKYEDLISSPHQTINNLFKFLNIDPENVFKSIAPNVHWMGNASMFKFNGTIYPNTKWKNELSEDQIKYITQHTESTYKKLGY